MRCWNCGLPDVGERCPRCGAPQERRGPPMPPPAPPGNGRPPPGFIVNGTPIDLQPDGLPGSPMPPRPGSISGPLPPRTPSGPLPPRPGSTSSPLPPRSGPPSGPLSARLAGQSGPLPARPGSTSGPLPNWPAAPSGPLPVQPGPAGGFPAGGVDRRPRPTSAPLGWEDDGMMEPQEYRQVAPPGWQPGPPAARRGPPVQPARDWPDEPPMEPAPGPMPGRGPSQPIPRGQPAGWDDEMMGRATGELSVGIMQNSTADARGGKRGAARGPEMAGRLEPTWDDYRWGWTDQETLSLSGAFNALVGAAIGGMIGGAVWVGVAIATNLSLPYLAVLVGLLAGLGARFALEQTRPWSLGLFAALGAALGYVAAQYGLFDAALVRQGTAAGWFPLSPLHFPQVYVDYIIGVADDVTTALGQSGRHPLEPVFLLICMGVCWLLVLRRKQ